MDKTVKTKISKKKGVVVERGIKSNSISVVVIVVLTFILYGNTVRNNYLKDDNVVTNKNDLVQKGIKAIPEIFSALFDKDDGKFNFNYRPVPKSTFALEYEYFGDNPHISHFINLLIYSITGIILFLLLRTLFKDYNYLFSLVITVIFIAHPIHTEVVASLKNRDEMLFGCQ